MPKQPTKLEILNDLRHQFSMVPLNQEPANIDERIKRLQDDIASGARVPINKSKLDAKSAEPKKTKGVKADVPETDKKATKTGRTKSADPKKSSPPKEDAKGVRIGDICKRLGIDARAARIKLRAAYKDQKKSGAPDTIGDSWLWKPGDVAKIESILRGE